jgi:hypothetical protein
MPALSEVSVNKKFNRRKSMLLLSDDEEEEDYDEYFVAQHPHTQLPRQRPNPQPQPTSTIMYQERMGPPPLPQRRLKSPPPPQRVVPQNGEDDVSSSYLGMWSKFFPSATPAPPSPPLDNTMQRNYHRPNNRTTTTMGDQYHHQRHLQQHLQIYTDGSTPRTMTTTRTREAAWADDVQSSRTDKRVLEDYYTSTGNIGTTAPAAGPAATTTATTTTTTTPLLLRLPEPAGAPAATAGQLSPNTQIKKKISKKWKARRKALVQELKHQHHHHQQQEQWNTDEDWCRENRNQDWPGDAFHDDGTEVNTTAATAATTTTMPTCCYWTCCMPG